MVYLYWHEEAWYSWIILIGAMLSLVGFVASCVCGCRRSENKNEFGGLAGMVTITHPDNDGFNRLPTSDGPHPVGQDTTDAGKRTSANRSLPDIPKDGSMIESNRTVSLARDIIYETNEVICDPSELYATVEDKNSRQSTARNSERDVQGILHQSILDENETVSPYARLKNLDSKNEEHPYAQVQSVQRNEISQKNRNTIGHLVDTSVPSSSSNHTNNPVAPPRSRKSSSHNSLLATETIPDIQAANAITGGVQANQDLPYMTPPISMPLPEPPRLNQPEGAQQHFSGDSHDSKGYTSISVREPLANIIAQTKAAQQQRQQQRALTDPHYATVSDDSDEMYAAIDEQEKVYTSGSETYAQIQPMTTEPARQSQNEQIYTPQLVHADETHSSAPQPPSVDSLRHVAHAHSRQASSSSATSSVANLGSPKPEKRQANSPLPPPPETVGDAYASVEKRVSRDERSRASVTSGKSLEDMYAKVVKKKREADDEAFEAVAGNSYHPEIAISNRKHSLVETSRSSWSSHDSMEIQKKELDPPSFSGFHNETETSSATFLAKGSSKKPTTEANGSEADPGYEAVDTSRKNNSIVRTVSDSDPNYEVLRPQFAIDNHQNATSQRNSVDAPPVYSSPFKHRQVSNASSEDPGYERVRTRRRIEPEDTDSEPNYESMPHDSGEPNYASVCRPGAGDSDTDPNYESVSHSDPNYESVKYMSVSKDEDPPYEQVNTNYKNPCDVGDYERVSKKNHVDPDYEKIELNHGRDHPTDGDTDDEQYIQV